MHIFKPRFFVLSIVAILLIVCQATQPSNAINNSESTILGSLRLNGKGLPNGRSDSQEPHTKLKGISQDPTYGYTKENPIKVGIGNILLASASEKYYLNSLLSETGKPIEYERVGSCCQFETPNALGGVGSLDVFTIKVPEKNETIKLYLNMYDPLTPIAPKGFTLREN
ncbi:MAG: hypothetical protein NTX45_09155 [Proteobacteria bacterium]|nr:hypothetical protein [Pseudomonadota bacterium]